MPIIVRWLRLQQRGRTFILLETLGIKGEAKETYRDHSNAALHLSQEIRSNFLIQLS